MGLEIENIAILIWDLLKSCQKAFFKQDMHESALSRIWFIWIEAQKCQDIIQIVIIVVRLYLDVWNIEGSIHYLWCSWIWHFLFFVNRSGRTGVIDDIQECCEQKYFLLAGKQVKWSLSKGIALNDFHYLCEWANLLFNAKVCQDLRFFMHRDWKHLQIVLSCFLLWILK